MTHTLRRSFGVEEEFILLDPQTLMPVDLGRRAAEDLSGRVAGAVKTEFFASQIEHATAVCTTADAAFQDLTAFRRALAAWADRRALVAAGTGTPPQTTSSTRLVDDARYERISHDIAGLAAEHQINGLHIHLAIRDRDEGIAISNGLRPWLAPLLALSANSPLWAGADTGFDSWRTLHSRRWTTFGIPPLFRDAAHYDDVVADLTGIGATSDAGTINWAVRLSPRHPTAEVRVCDAQLDPESTLALALLVRALADAVLDAPPPDPECAVWDAALWHAARHGAGAQLVHPLTGRPAPAARVVRALCAHAAPHLADHGERDLVVRFLTQALAGQGGAEQQRRAFAQGPAALVTLYRDRLVAGTALAAA